MPGGTLFTVVGVLVATLAACGPQAEILDYDQVLPREIAAAERVAIYTIGVPAASERVRSMGGSVEGCSC